MLSWIAQEANLSNDALTVRAQTISPNDDGRLLWDLFFPRKEAPSVEINEISTLDFRPVSDRREWNQRGRLIPLKTPAMRDIKMVPVESYFTTAEEEIQKYEERSLGNEGLFRQLIGALIPDRIDSLVQANYRRLEVDAMRAWANGTIVAMDPQRGTTATVSFGFPGTRYTTAGTAWNNVGINGYDAFLAWLDAAVDLVGPIAGVMMRRATFNAIQVDAPNYVTGTAIPRLTREQLRQRISDELGVDFQFYINESTVDIFTDGGIASGRVAVWPAQKVAVVPAGLAVGNMHFAPVARAFEIARNAPDAGIDVRGQTVYTEIANGGRQATFEAQVNALPIPDEGRLCVIDAGV